MGATGSDWFGLTEDGRFLRWVEGTALREDVRLGELPRSRPAAQVRRDSTLRNAMEVIMTSQTSVAVIDDGGRFGAVVTLEQIRQGLAAKRRRSPHDRPCPDPSAAVPLVLPGR